MSTLSNLVTPGRILADLGPHDGALLLVTCLVHGNEPAGEQATQELLSHLPVDSLHCRLVVLRGNLAAAQSGARCLDRDLNRLFPTTNPPKGAIEDGIFAEENERNELKSLILELAEEHAGRPRYFLDLHTTSSDTLPYVSLPSASKSCREFAAKLPIHRVSGFAQHVSGSIDRYLHERDYLGFACEGGQHESRESVRSMTALLWLMLDEIGGFPEHPTGEVREGLEKSRTFLEEKAGGTPKYFTIVYRHELTGDEEFVMKPGFANFHAVREGDLLAHDRDGEILAPQDGHLLMPLYQKSGNDGFFIVSEHDPIARE